MLLSANVVQSINRVPTRIGKPGKMGRHFPVRKNHTKYWKTEGISDKYYLLFFSDI